MPRLFRRRSNSGREEDPRLAEIQADADDRLRDAKARAAQTTRQVRKHEPVIATSAELAERNNIAAMIAYGLGAPDLKGEH